MAVPPKLKQPLPGEAWKRPVVLMDDPEFEASYPTLCVYLTTTEWEGGTYRQTSTLTVFVEAGGMTVILNDRANLRSVFIQESSLFSCLVKLDTVLADGTAEWKSKKSSANSLDNKVPF